MNTRLRIALAATFMLVLVGCGEGVISEEPLPDAGRPEADAGLTPDDAGIPHRDAGDPIGPIDAGTGGVDAGEQGGEDAGAADGGLDGGGDAGVVFEVEKVDLRREPLALGSSPRVAFRYRSYAGSRPSWVSPGTTTIAHQLGQGVRSISRGADLSSLYATQFDGIDDGYLGDSAVTTQAGGFTIESWFRPDAMNGYRTLFSNTEGNRGFSLKIVDGVLRVLARVQDGGSTVTYTLFDPEPLQAGRWYVAAGHAAVVDGTLRLRLYRDHRLVAESFHPLLGGLAQSSSRPAVGAEPTSGALERDWYSGELYAVVLHDHPVDHDVLVTPQLRDGSRYLGGPSYHDYLSATESMATRIARTDRRYPDMARVRARFGLPLLNDDWVPQGVASSADGRTIWLSGYVQDADGANPQNKASMVAEIDLEAQAVTRILRLVDASGANLVRHVGGLGELDGSLYIPSASRVFRFVLADAVLEKAAVPGVHPPVYRLAVSDDFPTRSGGSFLDVDHERRSIWVGEFNNTGEERGAIDRYELGPDGRILRPARDDSDERHLLPVDKVQGAVALPGEPLTFVLSTSYGNNASRIYRWTPGQPASLVATLPAGTEDIDRSPDGTVWTMFESGARYYQKRSSPAPWTDLSPFLIGLRL